MVKLNRVNLQGKQFNALSSEVSDLFCNNGSVSAEWNNTCVPDSNK
jgi:hypothetical protein